MLVRHDIVLVVGVEWLMMWRDVNVFGWELDACELFEEICVVS